MLVAFLYHLIRWPLLMFLVILEPFVRFVLSSVAILGTLTALMFRVFLERTQFPFWLTLALSFGCLGALILYYISIKLLASSAPCVFQAIVNTGAPCVVRRSRSRRGVHVRGFAFTSVERGRPVTGD